jgi:H+-transporting ATPase
LTPQIAARAYELYERQGHRDGQSAQNWDKAEQEIRETQAKAEPKLKPNQRLKPNHSRKLKLNLNLTPIQNRTAKVEPTPAAKVEPKPETKLPKTSTRSQDRAGC